MKILDKSGFELYISEWNLPSLDCRIDVYSCKMQGSERQNFYNLSTSQQDNFSPPLTFAYGNLSLNNDKQNIKSDDFSPPHDLIDDENMKMKQKSYIRTQSRVVFFLVNSLNMTFAPDYDFSQCQAKHFTKESDLSSVITYIDDLMGKTLKENFFRLRDKFWQRIDLEISLENSSVFSFSNTLDATPFTEDDCIWSFAYFFYNKKFNRLIVFICRSLRNSNSNNDILPSSTKSESKYLASQTEISQEYDDIRNL